MGDTIHHVSSTIYPTATLRDHPSIAQFASDGSDCFASMREAGGISSCISNEDAAWEIIKSVAANHQISVDKVVQVISNGVT